MLGFIVPAKMAAQNPMGKVIEITSIIYYNLCDVHMHPHWWKGL